MDKNCIFGNTFRIRADYRQALVYRYGDEFESLAEQIEMWRDASQELRPAYLLGKILVESGLYDYYQHDDPKRLENIKMLVNVFQKQDDLGLHPDTALRSIIEYISLAIYCIHTQTLKAGFAGRTDVFWFAVDPAIAWV